MNPPTRLHKVRSQVLVHRLLESFVSHLGKMFAEAIPGTLSNIEYVSGSRVSGILTREDVDIETGIIPERIKQVVKWRIRGNQWLLRRQIDRSWESCRCRGNLWQWDPSWGMTFHSVTPDLDCDWTNSAFGEKRRELGVMLRGERRCGISPLAHLTGADFKVGADGGIRPHATRVC